MRIDITQTFKDQDSKLVTKPDKSSEYLTLKDVISLSLIAQKENDVSPDEKLKRYDIFEKIRHCTHLVELTIDEVKTIQDLVGAVYGTLIYGQVYYMLKDGSKMKHPKNETNSRQKLTEAVKENGVE